MDIVMCACVYIYICMWGRRAVLCLFTIYYIDFPFRTSVNVAPRSDISAIDRPTVLYINTYIYNCTPLPWQRTEQLALVYMYICQGVSTVVW